MKGFRVSGCRIRIRDEGCCFRVSGITVELAIAEAKMECGMDPHSTSSIRTPTTRNCGKPQKSELTYVGRYWVWGAGLTSNRPRFRI